VNARDKNFTKAKLKKPMNQVEASIERYMAALEACPGHSKHSTLSPAFTFIATMVFVFLSLDKTVLFSLVEQRVQLWAFKATGEFQIVPQSIECAIFRVVSGRDVLATVIIFSYQRENDFGEIDLLALLWVHRQGSFPFTVLVLAYRVARHEIGRTLARPRRPLPS
jgi:hypothetical protein